MPTAVTIESMENTTSMSTTWAIATASEGAAGFASSALELAGTRLHLGVDLMRRLGNQEQSASDQDDVVPRERLTPQNGNRVCQPHHPGERKQQSNPKHQCQRQSELPDSRGTVRLEARHQHRDEDDVIDAENDLERAQGDECKPRIGIGEKPEHSQTLCVQ